jgi:uncharacterized surface protein with fasciclin (FAS1) repeats
MFMSTLSTHRTRLLAIALAASAFGLASLPASAHHMDEKQAALEKQLDPNGTIVANAAKVPDLSTLVAAVKAAGLVETLSGPGPFTVIAPTNAAFAALPKGTLDTLLKPENKDKLTAILTYHVLPQAYTVEQLGQAVGADKSVTVKTVQGGSVKLTDTGKGGHWTVTDAKGNVAKVVFKGLKVSNGTVYVVDRVLMP